MYSVNEKVVYPGHGVARIEKIIEKPTKLNLLYDNYPITGLYLFDQKYFIWLFILLAFCHSLVDVFIAAHPFFYGADTRCNSKLVRA